MPLTDVTTDIDNRTLTMTCDFPVTPERLWQVWADPRQLEKWWGPESHPARVTEHDLTPGGLVKYHMTGPDGEIYPGGWEVIAVDPPHRLEARDFFADADGNPVDTAPQSRMLIEITATEGGSRMVNTSTWESAEDMQNVLDMGVVEGSSSAIGQLDALLAA
ncbi:SRPBCC domain-containing protein [Janibacter cremeus]|uniref:SRPBCC family protein n=1 Tax=Janibacter cremeus TaxID=1285192 RepID=UPI0023F618FF|nr:SRPBCC domain-containing protein [Janibacter cremeus]WEV77302.1 SRPBCC domain-containing protein [Janibacter cremeus]